MLKNRVKTPENWKITSVDLDYSDIETSYPPLVEARAEKMRLIAIPT